MTIVDQPAKLAISRDIADAEQQSRCTPPTTEMSVVSITNCRMMSRLPRADRAAHADLARPLQHAGQHDVHDADAADEQRDRRDRHHHDVEDPLGALLLREQLRGRRSASSRPAPRCATSRMPRTQSPRPPGCRRSASSAGRCRRSRPCAQLLSVLEPEHRRVERHVNQVVPVLRGKPGHVRLRGQLRPGDAYHLEPLLVDLHELPDRIVSAEQCRPRPPRRARRPPPRAGGLLLVKKRPAATLQTAYLPVLRARRRRPPAYLRRRLRNHLRRREAFARRHAAMPRGSPESRADPGRSGPATAAAPSDTPDRRRSRALRRSSFARRAPR